MPLRRKGADGNFMRAQKEARDGQDSTEGEGSNNYFGVLLKNLTTDAWAVIIILMIMFVIAAWVMVSKTAHGHPHRPRQRRLHRTLPGGQGRRSAVRRGAGVRWARRCGSLYQVGSQGEVGKRQAQGA